MKRGDSELQVMIELNKEQGKAIGRLLQERQDLLTRIRSLELDALARYQARTLPLAAGWEE